MSIPVTKERLHLFDHAIPLELPGNRKKHIVRLITCLPETLQILPLQCIDTLEAAQHWTPKCRTSVEVSSYQFKDTAHWLIIAAANLLQHDAAPLLQFVLTEGMTPLK